MEGSKHDRKRTNHLRTTGQASLTSSITSLFGPKAVPLLAPVRFNLSVPLDKTMAKREGLNPDTKLPVRVSGMVSRAELGAGRTSSMGGQYYYMNGRPFNPGKVSLLADSHENNQFLVLNDGFYRLLEQSMRSTNHSMPIKHRLSSSISRYPRTQLTSMSVLTRGLYIFIARPISSKN